MNHTQEKAGRIRQLVKFGGILLLLIAIAGLRPSEAANDAGMEVHETAEEGAHGGHDGGLVSFHLNLVAWTWITFAIVLAVLWKFAWKPLIGAIDDRASRIQGDMSRAEEERGKAEELRQQYELRLAKAEEEAARIVADGKEDAEKTARGILEEAQKESEQVKVRANREIDQAKARALDEVWRQAADVSTLIASKVLERAVSPEDHRRLIQETIDGYRRELGHA